MEVYDKKRHKNMLLKCSKKLIQESILSAVINLYSIPVLTFDANQNVCFLIHLDTYLKNMHKV